MQNNNYILKIRKVTQHQLAVTPLRLNYFLQTQTQRMTYKYCAWTHEDFKTSTTVNLLQTRRFCYISQLMVKEMLCSTNCTIITSLFIQ